MDLDSAISLSYQGHPLEIAEEFNFFEPYQSISSFYPPQFLPFKSSDCVSTSLYTDICQEEMDRSSESPPFVYPETNEHQGESAKLLAESESFPLKGSELDGRLWIEPACSLRERLALAIEYLKEYVLDREILVQIWVPINREGKIVLTTNNQPFFVNPSSKSLASYRNVCENFHFSAEVDRQELTGLPGRAFLWKLPEWSPDVRFFGYEECPRKNYAEMYNISGCLAVPVLERDSGACLAVVEIVTTSQKTSYLVEREIICKALEAVDLKSSQYYSHPGAKGCNEFYQFVVPELSEISQSVCEKYKLPLALTWVLRSQQRRSELQLPYISTVDSACFVADTNLLEFHLACSEQDLFLDQGIVGKAFRTNKQCFANDVTSFSKAIYPLSHHARMFGLGAAIAIPLRSIYTGSVEFVLELFLPKSCRNIEEQKQMWDVLTTFIKQACLSFHVVIEKEFEEEINQQMELDSDGRFTIEESRRSELSDLKEDSLEQPSMMQQIVESQRKGRNVPGSWDFAKEEPEEEFRLTTQWENNDLHLYHVEDYGELVRFQQDSETKTTKNSGGRKAGEKKQTKPEKKISLQVIRQYFAGSLKEAANNLGVCPTTLKRICRQHGITRWPARKIKKVNHSLKKLQLVIDSVEGSEGLVRLNSFFTTFPDLSCSNDPVNTTISSSKKNKNALELNEQPESDLHSSKDTDSNSGSPSGSYNCGLRTNKKLSVRSGFSAEQSSSADIVFRVKATYGEENIRFSLQPTWNFRNLQQEIAKRFAVDDFTRFYLKYLDIDQEQVLLTCDADLAELRDLFKSYASDTIKMFLHHSHERKLESSS